MISGEGGFTKQGIGTLNFSGLNPNPYSGGTRVEAGTLQLSGGSGLADGSGLSVSSGAIFDLDLSDVIGSISGSGDIELASGVILSAGADNSSSSFEGVISGAGGFSKQGSGTLNFSGSSPNTYSGGTSVEGGILQLSGGSGLARGRQSPAGGPRQQVVQGTGGGPLCGPAPGAGGAQVSPAPARLPHPPDRHRVRPRGSGHDAGRCEEEHRRPQGSRRQG